MDYIGALHIEKEICEEHKIFQKVDTRRKRRRVLEAVARHVAAIRDGELHYMNNVPENLCGSESYKTAEGAVSVLDEIIIMLNEVYP